MNKSVVFNAKKLTIAFAVAPLALSSIIAFAGSAEAAALLGDFQLNGGFLSPGGLSTATFSKNALKFKPDSLSVPEPNTPIAIGSQTGNFATFDTGLIGNIISFSSPFAATNPFIDLGKSNLGIPGVTTIPNLSLTDNLNTYTLTSADYTLSQTPLGKNVSIDVALGGYFTSADGKVSEGYGNLTFQINNKTLAQVNTILNKTNPSQNTISGLTFSGGLFTTEKPAEPESVPEPLTLLGAGTGILFGGIFKRKLNKKNKKESTKA